MIDASSGNHFNFGGSGQIAIDTWGTADEGNRFQIEEISVASDETIAAINSALIADARDEAAMISVGDVRVGSYRGAAVTALNAALAAYGNSQTADNISNVKTEYYSLLTNGAKVTLSEGDIFTVKCIAEARGYMVYSAVEGKESDTYPNLACTGENYTSFPRITDPGVHEEWAFININGNNCIYNVDRKRFLNPKDIIEFGCRGYGFELVPLANAQWEIKFTSNNRYLAFSPAYGLNQAVRTLSAGQIDDGCKFYIEKTGRTVSSGLSAEMQDYHTTAVWKSEALSTLGYVYGYEKSLSNALELIVNGTERAAFEDEHEKIQPGKGYYFIKGTGNSNNSNAYITYSGTDCKSVTLGNGEKVSSKHVWYFDPVEDGYKFKNCNKDKYLQSADAPNISQIAYDKANGYKYVLTDKSSVKGIAHVNIKDGNGYNLRTEDNGDVNRWGIANDEETWYLIPAGLDITIGDAGYASAYYSFPVTLPAGLEAYAITAAAGENATLVQKTDIPATQGAILKGTAGTTYKLTAQEATSDWTDNKLTGTNEDTYVEGSAVGGNAYVLAEVNDNVGLYKAKLNKNADGTDAVENGTHFKNNANKAYLPASAVVAGARFLTFDFDDNAETGIKAVEIEEAAPANAAIYDLSGRRVQNAKSGLYIINGKKVIK